MTVKWKENFWMITPMHVFSVMIWLKPQKDYTEYNEKYNEMTQQVMDEMGITQGGLR